MKKAKKIIAFFLSAIMMMSFSACSGNDAAGRNSAKEENSNVTPTASEKTSSNANSKGKILVAYFSHTGNTKKVANQIHKMVGGDIFEIVTVETYPADHDKCSEIAQKELQKNYRPPLSTHVKDMNSYEIVYLGYPIWWHTAPMAIRTFLEEYNFSGKTIIPFCTSLGDGISESVKDISQLSPHSKFLDGFALRNMNEETMPGEVSAWLKKIGML